MDSGTGEIYRELDAKELLEAEQRHGRRMIPLTEAQADALEPLGARKRKGYMRNQPCVCGSGRKFKRCCWSKYQ